MLTGSNFRFEDREMAEGRQFMQFPAADGGIVAIDIATIVAVQDAVDKRATPEIGVCFVHLASGVAIAVKAGRLAILHAMQNQHGKVAEDAESVN